MINTFRWGISHQRSDGLKGLAEHGRIQKPRGVSRVERRDEGGNHQTDAQNTKRDAQSFNRHASLRIGVEYGTASVLVCHTTRWLCMRSTRILPTGTLRKLPLGTSDTYMPP